MDKKALFKLSYGMYIISSKNGQEMNGQVANTVFQITSKPTTIAVSINKQNLTHEFIEKSKIFTISILSIDTPMTLIGKFGFKSGRSIDKFSDTAFKIGVTSAPIVLENSLAYLEIKLLNSLDVGTHTVFIGEVVNGETIEVVEPMTYSYYHQVKKGKSPKTAPTYIAEAKEKNLPKSVKGFEERYKCTICSYIYDPVKGDSSSNIAPNTPFIDLPADWVCPICGAGKQEFIKLRVS